MNDIIIALISVIGGGALSSLFTLKYTKSKAKAEAESTVVDNYETYTTRIESRLKELEEEVKGLKEKNDKLYNAVMSGYKCPYLRENPELCCPVQEAFKEKEGGIQ